MVPARRSTSSRLSPSTSPLRRVPQAASVTAAWYCSGMDCVSAATWSTFGIRRSVTRSVPPPFTRQGFFTMRSSSMAVLKIAFSSRYAFGPIRESGLPCRHTKSGRVRM